MRKKDIISKKIVYTAADPLCRRTKAATDSDSRLWLVFAVLVVFCAAGAGTAAADTVNAGNFTELRDAINEAVGANSTRTIIITEDIGVGAEGWLPAITAGKNITLKPAEIRDYRIVRTDRNISVNSGLFTVSGGNLTIADSDADTTLTLDGNRTVFTGNYQPFVRVGNGGTFVMSGGMITNSRSGSGFGGGVVSVYNSSFTFSGGTISDNIGNAYGGGVYVYNGSFTMSGGVITNNTGTSDGGGVYATNNSTFMMSGGTISDSTGMYGGGVNVYRGSMFVMEGGTITNNTARSRGGGVYISLNSTLTISGGEISNNNASSTSNEGGGVYITGSTFTMSGDAKIIGNRAVYGGGVEVRNGGSFIMSGGTISDNTAVRGGGVEVFGMFTFVGGEIIRNNATNSHGGGVYVIDGSTFTMSGDAKITGNNAARDGGGVYNNGVSTISGGIISNNTGGMNGGGVALNRGNFTISGGTISNNTAVTNGGGVYVVGPFTMEGDAKVTGNTAGNGSGVYVTTGGTFMKSGSASVDATDEVYLTSNTFINVTSQLAGGAMNITHADNVAGTKVIELHPNAIDAYYSTLFDLSPAMSSFFLKYNDTNMNTPIYELAVRSAPTPTPTPTPTSTPIPTPIPTSTPTPTDGGNMKNSFRVLFETFGGSTVPPITGLSYGDRITAPSNPTKDGYTFGGWYKDETCTLAWIFATDAVPGDITLYAKWIGGTTPTMTSAEASPTAVPTTGQPTVTATAASTTEPASGTTGDQNQPGGISIEEILLFVILILVVIFLLLLLLLRHTVTFLITTAEGVEKYRVKVWHGKKIDTDDLPDLIKTMNWYTDEERRDRWSLTEERVTKSIRLYPGHR